MRSGADDEDDGDDAEPRALPGGSANGEQGK
jgi:hypothetical protein